MHWAEKKQKVSMPYINFGIPSRLSRLNLAEHWVVRKLLSLHVWV